MQALSQTAKTARIRDLNDAFRRTFKGGLVLLSAGFNALPEQTKLAVVKRLKKFDAFDSANDPYGEHDFVSIEISRPGDLRED